MNITKKDLKKISENIWEIPKSFRSDMRVPARVYASEKLLEKIWEDQSLEQLVNTATLPGVYKYTLAMPDMHEGYGCPIGGVIATDIETGIISPGAIGYDINCGVRTLVSGAEFRDIEKSLPELIERLFRDVPSGVGSTGKIKLTPDGMKNVLERGSEYVIERGYGLPEDLSATEEGGRIKQADASLVSDHAKSRGHDQLGTLGSGNHFLEIQKVEKIYDEEMAKKWNLILDRITITIHSGSRGLGHQNCADYVGKMRSATQKYHINLPDPELSCAPFSSPEGQSYFKSMNAAANFAWANRQCMVYYVRQVWQKIMKGKIKDISLRQVYDVAHNIAKIEEYDGKQLVIHRKGATRAFQGQPVIIPGSMGTASYLLIGQDAEKETFGTVCHGAGRIMSRTQAKRSVWGKDLQQQLAKKGIIAKSHSMSGLAEEAPIAYKDIDEVVNVVHNLNLAKKVARLVPLGVVKG